MKFLRKTSETQLFKSEFYETKFASKDLPREIFPSCFSKKKFRDTPHPGVRLTLEVLAQLDARLGAAGVAQQLDVHVREDGRPVGGGVRVGVAAAQHEQRRHVRGHEHADARRPEASSAAPAY